MSINIYHGSLQWKLLQLLVVAAQVQALLVVVGPSLLRLHA
jgi:hypothetical protein